MKPVIRLSQTGRIALAGVYALLVLLISALTSLAMGFISFSSQDIVNESSKQNTPIEIASEIKISLDRVEDLVVAVEKLAESAKEKDEELARVNRELEVLRDMNGWSEETRKEFYRMMNPPIWQDWLFRFIQVLLGAAIGLVTKIWWDKREARITSEPKNADNKTS